MFPLATGGPPSLCPGTTGRLARQALRACAHQGPTRVNPGARSPPEPSPGDSHAGAFALGRKTDELIISALDTSTNEAIGTNVGETDNDGMTRNKVLLAFQALGANDVPDDGQRFAVVGWKQWSELLTITEFAHADYAGPDELPWKGGTQAKKWLGALWMPHSGLTKNGSLRYCYFFHKTAVAHATASEVITDVTWHGDRAAYFVNSMMSQGAVLVDGQGAVRMRCKE